MSKLNVSSSPHIHSNETTKEIMLDVIISLLPATIFGIIIFGYRAAIVLAVSVVSCVLFEFLGNKAFGREVSIGDLSAVVTGILLGLNLPSGIPIYMVVIGGAVATFVVKQMFGGLGCNFVNPAIAARIVLLISFPTAMTTFLEPFTSSVSSATPLVSEIPFTVKELFFGVHAGTIGETSAPLLLAGGIYLVLRRVINPVIPLSFIGTVALLSFLFGTNPLTAILSGGVILGAVFMATDYVTSPTNNIGKLIFGIGCGVMTVIIRSGSAAEGVSFAILFMNLLVPHIDTLTIRRPFGWEAKKGE